MITSSPSVNAQGLVKLVGSNSELHGFHLMTRSTQVNTIGSTATAWTLSTMRITASIHNALS